MSSSAHEMFTLHTEVLAEHASFVGALKFETKQGLPCVSSRASTDEYVNLA